MSDAAKGTIPNERYEIGGVWFHVLIDGHYDLGNWYRVEGLSVKFELAEYRAGDTGNRRWIEPAHTTYSNVKLSRATTLKYTKLVMDWLQETSFTRQEVTAKITGVPLWHENLNPKHIVTWNLRGVIPVSWSGPQFDASTGKMATETLELAHEGFLDPMMFE
jgi:phage tail-like protein